MQKLDEFKVRQSVIANRVDFGSLISRALRHWYWFGIMGALAILSAWFYLKSVQPIYQVSSKILIQEDKKTDMVGLSTLGLATPFSDQFMLVNEVEVLKSRGIMEKVIESLNINVRFFEKGRFVDEELYGDLAVSISFLDSIKYFYDRRFSLNETSPTDYEVVVELRQRDTGDWIPTDTILGRYGRQNLLSNRTFIVNKNFDFEKDIIIEVNNPRSLAIGYSRKLEITPIVQSEVLEISLKDNITSRSMAIINKLVDVYNKEVLDNKNRSTNNTLDFIDERLSFITQELFDVENELENFKRENEVPIELSQSAEQYLNKISANNDAIQKLELQENVLEGIINELNRKKLDYEFLSVNLTIGNETPVLISDYNRMIMQRNRLLVSATDQNPAVKGIDNQIEQVKENLVDWAEFKKNELAGQKEFLIKEGEPISSRVNSIPKYEREMLEIMRQQAIKEALFTFLLQRREETAMTIASEVSNARFINEPFFESKVSPKNMRIYVVFLAMGLAIPALLVYLFEYYDNYVYSKSDLVTLTSAPFLGEIPDIGKTDQVKIGKGSKSVLAEMFRLLRTNIKFLSPKQGSQCFLVTSTIGGEGKTFIGINLATSIALSGKKVVIVGFDLRKPKLQTYLKDNDNDYGVTNYLIDPNIQVSSILRPTEYSENLSYIACGPVPPNPNELILGERTATFFEELRGKFDYIVIDSPPVGLVADAFCLKEHVDFTLYITRFEYTKKDQVSFLNDIYESQKLPNLSIVLNGMKRRLGRSYGSYGGYSYTYGSNYYEETPKGFWAKMKSKFSS